MSFAPLSASHGYCPPRLGSRNLAGCERNGTSQGRTDGGDQGRVFSRSRVWRLRWIVTLASRCWAHA